MSDKRRSNLSLSGTRIYIKRGYYRYDSDQPLFNTKTGKYQKSHHLCPVSDGEICARAARQQLIRSIKKIDGPGDFGFWIEQWKTVLLKNREMKSPKDPARKNTWKKGALNITSALHVIGKYFENDNIAQVKGYHVARFLDQWEGRRSAQTYRSYLSKFFEWCISRHGLIEINPAMQIRVKPPRKREVYFTDKQFNAIRDALLIGNDGKPTRTGNMIQCYMDLLYLLFQRGTDIRLLRNDEITEDGIEITPTKTAFSSRANVMIPINDNLRSVFDRIKRISKVQSSFVIHTEKGEPYTASGVRSAFNRAAKRANVKGVTLKDIRAKAASDAAMQGYKIEQIQVVLAHRDTDTTRDYIRNQSAPVSAVIIKLPEHEPC